MSIGSACSGTSAFSPLSPSGGASNCSRNALSEKLSSDFGLAAAAALPPSTHSKNGSHCPYHSGQAGRRADGQARKRSTETDSTRSHPFPSSAHSPNMGLGEGEREREGKLCESMARPMIPIFSLDVVMKKAP